MKSQNVLAVFEGISASIAEEVIDRILKFSLTPEQVMYIYRLLLLLLVGNPATLAIMMVPSVERDLVKIELEASFFLKSITAAVLLAKIPG